MLGYNRIKEIYITMMQRTIKNSISCLGIGVHSGALVSLSLYPAPVDSGITFIRTDIKGKNNKIKANYNLVSRTRLGTTIQNNDLVEVSTIEHLMAALWGCQIDNVIVEIDASELPIMDGSSGHFVFMIECAGTKIQDKPRKYIEILKEISVQEGDSSILISPSNHFSVDAEINYNSKVISSQNFKFSDCKDAFKRELAKARTFGFKEEAEMLRKNGLAKGASLDNAVVISDDKILNADGLRYEDEFVRHKLLDLLGDFYLAGAPLKAHIKSFKPGHAINNKALHAIFAEQDSWQVIQ